MSSRVYNPYTLTNSDVSSGIILTYYNQTPARRIGQDRYMKIVKFHDSLQMTKKASDMTYIRHFTSLLATPHEIRKYNKILELCYIWLMSNFWYLPNQKMAQNPRMKWTHSWQIPLPQWQDSKENYRPTCYDTDRTWYGPQIMEAQPVLILPSSFFCEL
jgi:hypothetical protein